MKNIILFIAFLYCINTNAQNNLGKADDFGRIILNTYLPDQIDGIPAIAMNQLENKLSQITSNFGMGGDSFNSRFIITLNVVVLSKNITATAPSMQALNLEITFYIGDGFDGVKFASYTTNVSGVGENENKAYISCFKNLKTNDPKLEAFINKGKSKIVEYYNSKCDFLIKQSQMLANTKQFDEAIFRLSSVPEICKDCFDKSMDAVAPIFKQKIEFECKSKLAEATSIWNANQSWEGAEDAGRILASIDPDASCNKDVKFLTAKISKKISEVDKREWNLTMEKEVGLKRDMIKAYRDVGVAYGNGQPKTVTYNTRGWW